MGMSVCSHCKQVLQKKEFPEDLKISYHNLRSASKTPVWMFSGLALAAILIVWGMTVSKQNDEKYAQMIVTPQKGDMYEVKIRQWTLYTL